MSGGVGSLAQTTPERLALLEAAQIATRVESNTSALRLSADHLLGAIENRIIEAVLLRRMRKALTKAGDQSAAMAFAQQMRAAYEDGLLETLPSFLPTGSHRSTPERPPEDEDQDERTYSEPARNLVLYVSGGGFLLPPSMRQKLMVQRLAEATQSEIVLATHRLAPEHPFPAAPEDVAQQYLGLLDEGIDPADIFLAGDTAGGGIALGALQLLRQQERALPCGVILFSPWCDLTLSGWSYISGSVSSRSPFRMETAAFCARLYLGEAQATDPLASAIYADAQGWPPMLIHTSEHDLHFDDALRLAENGHKQGNEVQLNYWDAPRHHLERLPDHVASESFRRVAQFMRRVRR